MNVGAEAGAIPAKVSDEVAAAVDVLYAEFVDARESRLERGKVGEDVGDDRYALAHGRKDIH
jgi:hypothetical protein